MIYYNTMGMTMTVTMITIRVQWGASTYSGVSNWGAAWYCSTWVSIVAWSSIIQYCGLVQYYPVLWPGPVLSSIAAWHCIRRHKKSDTDLVDRRPSLALVRKTYDPGNFLTNKITAIPKCNLLVFAAGVAVCVDRKICRATQRIRYLNIFPRLKRL